MCGQAHKGETMPTDKDSLTMCPPVAVTDEKCFVVLFHVRPHLFVAGGGAKQRENRFLNCLPCNLQFLAFVSCCFCCFCCFFFLTHDFLLFYFFVVYLSFFLHFFAILVIQLVYKVYLVCSMYICCVLSPLQLSLFPHDGAVGGLGFQR